MSEKQIVEAFTSFFHKSILPYVSGSDEVLREWNHLSKIITTTPIDYSQIQFYLLLANKAGGSGLMAPPNQPTIGSSTSISDQNKYKRGDKSYGFDRLNVSQRFQEKRSSQIMKYGNKKKLLIAGLQNFQQVLLQSQQKLQELNKRTKLQDQRSANRLNASIKGFSAKRY